MLTLEQLVTPQTEDEVLASSLNILRQLGFQATSWQSGSAQLTILRLIARIISALTTTVAQIAAGGFTTLASSAYLRLLAKYFYAIDYLPAQPTIGLMTLTSSAGAPIHTWNAGDIIVSDSAEGTAGANTYTCTAGGSLGPSSSTQLEFKADVAGAAGNIAPGVPIFLWTAYVGVTVTNPALLPGSNTWVTTPGEDEESDARLAARCLGRWERLMYGNTDGAYKGWALEALPALTRVSVNAAQGNGTVALIGATSLGPLSGPQCLVIENYINGVADGVGRRPINDIVSCDPAVIVTSPALTITAYVVPSVFDTIEADMTAALLAYIGGIPIGGTKLTAGSGVVIYSELVRIAQALTGVRSVDFSISADITLAQDEIYVPTITVNPQIVSPGA